MRSLSIKFGAGLLVMACLLTPPAANARWVPAWDYATLAEKSDLVVIAKAVETTDSTETWKGPETPPQNTIFAAVATTFQPEFIIKSSLKNQKVAKIELVHFEMRVMDPAKMFGYANGHSFVRFETKPYEIELRDAEGSRGCTYAPTYLLFLHQRPDGKFEPVTGQYDASCSVRAMHQTYLGDLLSHMKVKK